MAAACVQKDDRAVNFVTQSRNRVRVRVRFKAQCSIYNEMLCRMQQIYYMHDIVYIISAILQYAIIVLFPDVAELHPLSRISSPFGTSS